MAILYAHIFGRHAHFLRPMPQAPPICHFAAGRRFSIIRAFLLGICARRHFTPTAQQVLSLFLMPCRFASDTRQPISELPLKCRYFYRQPLPAEHRRAPAPGRNRPHSSGTAASGMPKITAARCRMRCYYRRLSRRSLYSSALDLRRFRGRQAATRRARHASTRGARSAATEAATADEAAPTQA